MDAVTLGKGNFAHVELATHSITEVKVTTVTCYRPAGGQTICPAAGGFSRNGDLRQSVNPKIAADLRPSADGSAVRTSLVAGGS